MGPGHTEQGRARPAGRVTHFCRVEFVWPGHVGGGEQCQMKLVS